VNSLLEEVGEALGDFFMVDLESSNLLHSTYISNLVDINAFKGLPMDIKHIKGFWI
jgi:hypothetical protein